MTDFFAHSGDPADLGTWQTLPDHLDQTAGLAAAAAQTAGLSRCAELAARFHDFGKYDPAFQRRLHGDPTPVDHSTAGASLLLDRAPAGPQRVVAEVLADAILGHHAGLPDTNGSDAARDRRIGRFRQSDPVPADITAATQIDLAPAVAEIIGKIRPGDGFDLSVAGRMVFSCLVDADFRDTEAFYASLEGRDIPARDWAGLQDLLPALTGAFDTRMAGFGASDLNRLRSEVLRHIRTQAALAPGLFTLTVPTGGGKTLASLGFALDRYPKARFTTRRRNAASPCRSTRVCGR